MSAPRALAVLADMPHPPRSGNHLRDLQTLRLLDALGYDVRAIAGVARTDAVDAGLGPVGTAVEAVPIPEYGLRPRDRARRVAAIVGGAAGSPAVDPWAYNHRRAGWDRLVLDAVERERPQVVVMRSLFGHLARPLARLGAQVVLDAHDSQVLLARALRAQAGRLGRWSLRLRERVSARAEAGYAAADELWVTSAREARHFAERMPSMPTIVVPNGVEPSPQQPSAADRSPELLLIGGFGWPPNVAAAETLVRHVLPRVRSRHPEVVVTLIGRDLPARILAERPQAVRWLGVVDDVRPFLRRAAALVFAPPASAATGTALKVSEALACGTPLVATPVATEELGLQSGVHAVIAEDPDDLAAGACRLLEEPAFADRLARNGLTWARETLSTHALAARLREGSLVGARSVPAAVS